MTTRKSLGRTEATDARKAARTFWLLGNRLTVLADDADTGGRYDLIEGHKSQGDQTPLHRHTRYDEQFYVVDGELTVWAGKREVVLHAKAAHDPRNLFRINHNIPPTKEKS